MPRTDELNVPRIYADAARESWHDAGAINPAVILAVLDPLLMGYEGIQRPAGIVYTKGNGTELDLRARLEATRRAAERLLLDRRIADGHI